MTEHPAGPEGPKARHRALVREGRLAPDPAQDAAVDRLQSLHERLKDPRPAKAAPAARGWFGLGRKASEAPQGPRGLYLHGGVGRGKSMLMDLFFDGAPVTPKRRVHFHAFMQEVHAAIAAARARGASDPIQPVAEGIAKRAKLLCFDEMQITDVADAMIVGRLFEGLFARGVVVVTTSNRHPDDLYKDGLNRGVFLPFIEMLKDRLEIHHLEGAEDHRRDRTVGERRWISPLGPKADAAAERIWRELSQGPEAPLRLVVSGRETDFPRASGRAVRTDFQALCGRPLGAGDYLALAGAVDALLLEGIPRLSRARNNEAARFVTLIDALYEAGLRLYATAEADPDTLYLDGPGAFEFRRTASRLEEMRSADWPRKS